MSAQKTQFKGNGSDDTTLWDGQHLTQLVSSYFGNWSSLPSASTQKLPTSWAHNTQTERRKQGPHKSMQQWISVCAYVLFSLDHL